MRVIAKAVLREYWTKHPVVEQQLKAWHKEMLEAEWTSAMQIKSKYPSASILDSQRVVFNIKGNHFRIVVRINYQFKIVWIRFVGTHKEYDPIDAKTI
ncbi:MAG: hypothetical protein RJB31_1315 [Bacteroidota bacterium]|jgi:mRNA interferase HigB